MERRWWDYRLMHPAEATYLFAEHYRRAVVDWHKRYVNLGSAQEDARAFTPDDIFQSRDLTGMWLARQAADMAGMPYEPVMAFMVDRSLTRGFSRPMRPNQLYGEEFTMDLATRWKQLGGFRQPETDYFKAGKFIGSPLQLAYRKELLATLGPNPSHRLIANLLRRDLVDAAFVRANYEPGLLARAVRYRALLTDQDSQQ